jgi:hypothetical protein
MGVDINETALLAEVVAMRSINENRGHPNVIHYYGMCKAVATNRLFMVLEVCFPVVVVVFLT